MQISPSWYRGSGSGVVVATPCDFIGALVTCSAAGDYIDIYDGADATSGRKIARLAGSGAGSFWFAPGTFRLSRGLYIVSSVGVSEFTVFYGV